MYLYVLYKMCFYINTLVLEVFFAETCYFFYFFCIIHFAFGMIPVGFLVITCFLESNIACKGTRTFLHFSLRSRNYLFSAPTPFPALYYNFTMYYNQCSGILKIISAPPAPQHWFNPCISKSSVSDPGLFVRIRIRLLSWVQIGQNIRMDPEHPVPDPWKKAYKL